jgi:hypothetical protein
MPASINLVSVLHSFAFSRNMKADREKELKLWTRTFSLKSIESKFIGRPSRMSLTLFKCSDRPPAETVPP